ncbi:hypothetical protein EPJ79_01480 [Brachyspira aalborgi]|uniref:Uncharacterized protein n=2 Tax=Brachyspira TaxID=29521 RepID=A0A5C8D322_9SPIR|nr:hypothetical protein [Brachyspira aalborgi]TXJ19857.1 hypothetical protein EPJ79_01480 [Brachyspira aalborgi]
MNNRQTISKSLLIIIALLLMVSCGKDDDKRLTDSKDSVTSYRVYTNDIGDTNDSGDTNNSGDDGEWGLIS